MKTFHNSAAESAAWVVSLVGRFRPISNTSQPHLSGLSPLLLHAVACFHTLLLTFPFTVWRAWTLCACFSANIALSLALSVSLCLSLVLFLVFTSRPFWGISIQSFLHSENTVRGRPRSSSTEQKPQRQNTKSFGNNGATMGNNMSTSLSRNLPLVALGLWTLF